MRVTLQRTLFSSILVFYGFDPSLPGYAGSSARECSQRTGRSRGPPAALIEGRTIDAAWLAALKDRDLGGTQASHRGPWRTHAGPSGYPADEKASLAQTEVRSLLFSDKDAAVRQAAAFFADLFKGFRFSRDGRSPSRGAQACRPPDTEGDPPGRRPGPTSRRCTREYLFSARHPP